MFGTFQEEDEEVVYGITTQPRSWNPLWLNFHYWGDLLKESSKAPKPLDAIRMLTLAPGWRPEQMGGMLAYKDVSSSTFEKYDTAVSPSLSNYILFQFVILLIGTSVLLFGEKALNWEQKAGASAFIIYTVVAIGGLFEKKTWVIAIEIIRLLLLTAIIIFIGLQFYQPVYVIAGAGVYLLLSLVWFGSTIKEITSNK
jgi:hypothetical protein